MKNELITTALGLLSILVVFVSTKAYKKFTSPKSILGIFKGYCKNNTGTESILMLSVIEQNGAKIEGMVTISGALAGAGNFKGTVIKNKIEFVSKDEHGIIITWIGQIEKNKMKGNYFTSLSLDIKEKYNISDQEGIWELHQPNS